jgi:hypothetical protein
MIVPTKLEGSFNTSKGHTLGDFAYYFLCEGQQQAPVLGYSPLPINLVKAGLEQVRNIPGVDVQKVDISKCNNPTFSANGTNTLAASAPKPPACDHQGATQCGAGGASASGGSAGGAGGTSGTSGGSASGSGTGTSGATGAGTSSGPGASTAGTASNPALGGRTPGGTAGAVAGTGSLTSGGVLPQDGTLSAGAVPVSVSESLSSSMSLVLGVLVVLSLAGVAFGPPLLTGRLARGDEP